MSGHIFEMKTPMLNGNGSYSEEHLLVANSDIVVAQSIIEEAIGADIDTSVLIKHIRDAPNETVIHYGLQPNAFCAITIV